MSRLEAEPLPEVGLGWLIRLRAWAAVGQVCAVILAQRLVWPELPLLPLGLLVGGHALSNLGLKLLAQRHPGRELAAGVLLLDTLLLTGLLFWSGGPSNPFSVIYLVHVTLAAVLLGARWTWLLASFSSLCFGLLFFWHDRSISQHMHHLPDGAFSAHLQGMWLAFALAAGLIAAFVGRLAEELRRREQQLAELRALAVRNEQLAALTTLAAGAAHELGTPLGTIAVVSSELQRSLEQHQSLPALIDDAQLIRQEVRRCRDILDQLSARSGESIAELPEPWNPETLLALIREKLPEGSASRLSCEGTLAPTVQLPHRAVAQVLAALIKNGLDASPPDTRIVLRLQQEPGQVRLSVQDVGCGMPRAVLERATDPFFTTKAPGQGMGLGLFLVRLFAERMNGRLELHSAEGSGTTAHLVLPQPLTPSK